MIENPAIFLPACAAASAACNFAMLKVSPQVPAFLRHAFAGAGPVIASLAGLIGLQDSVVADGGDLLVLGGSTVAGLAAAMGTTKLVRARKTLRHG